MVLEHYLDIGGVAGEAHAPDAKNQIRLVGWSLGVNQSASSAGSSLSAASSTDAGAVEVGGFEITKQVDASSPLLMTICAERRVTPQVKLMMRPVGQSKPRLLIDMREVSIHSVRIDAVADAEPVERAMLHFSKIWFGTARLERGTTTDDRTWFAWDLAKSGPPD